MWSFKMGILKKKRKREFRSSVLGTIKDVHIKINNKEDLSFGEDFCVVKMIKYYESLGSVSDLVNIEGSKKELIEFFNTLIDEIKEF